MKKIIISIIIAVCIILFISRTSNEDEEIRVRIISNGNSQADLYEKNKAKNITICYLNLIYDDDYSNFKAKIEKTYNNLGEILLEEGIDSTISFSNHTLYNKSYNDTAIKNEEKLTLYIVLGSGEGENWWGSIYPKFLSVSSEEEFKYESLILKALKTKGDL